MILFCNLCHKINSTVLGLKPSMYCRKIFLFFIYLFFLKAERHRTIHTWKQVLQPNSCKPNDSEREREIKQQYSVIYHYLCNNGIMKIFFSLVPCFFEEKRVPVHITVCATLLAAAHKSSFYVFKSSWYTVLACTITKKSTGLVYKLLGLHRRNYLPSIDGKFVFNCVLD